VIAFPLILSGPRRECSGSRGKRGQRRSGYSGRYIYRIGEPPPPIDHDIGVVCHAAAVGVLERARHDRVKAVKGLNMCGVFFSVGSESR
jgi:hypothetical protein